MNRRRIACALNCIGFASLFVATLGSAAEPLRPSQQTAVANVEARRAELNEVNKAIWEFAEVGLEERRSSALLVDKLKTAGFKVRVGVADMPTAFVAEFGSGRPVIGILAEYDALPGLSQKVSHERDPVVADSPGHGCGHCGLGTGALGAALAVKAAIEKHSLTGTVRLYGTPAEETLIGKVYMSLAGEFNELDACLHWHPGSRNDVWNGESKAAVSAKFTFSGVTAHASGSPDKGRSALDAVELMNVGANFMREHLKEDARVHYVITNGGGAPNVVPAKATVWYYVRANQHTDVERNFAWLRDIADGAAKMTRTTVSVQIDTDCHEIIPNDALATLMLKNLQRIGPPTFTPEEHTFARRIQESVTKEFGTTFKLALDEEVHRTPKVGAGSGSTDVGDISWHVPTVGLRTSCFASDAPGHSWQNVAAIGSTIGEKGVAYAAKVLACTTLDLLENPETLAAAKLDFTKKMENRKYITLIPPGQKAPKSIR